MLRFWVSSLCIVALVAYRKRNLKQLHANILHSKDKDFGSRFGLDMGGTLGKLVYYAKETELMDIQNYVLNYDKYGDTSIREKRLELALHNGDRLHFISFETSTIQQVVEFVLHRCFHRDIKCIPSTGGGAFKFSKLFDEELGVQLKKCDELACLIHGLIFVLKNVPDECYTFKNVSLNSRGLGTATKELRDTPQHALYPFLIVNIGSGVSILKVSSENSYERVSGTSLGGGTFLALCKLLSKYTNFNQAMQGSVEGDSQKVDMTVGDIYGGGYTKFNLSADTLASSFGKMGTTQEPRHGVLDKDIARSLLIMITQNIGQIAFLSAKKSNTNRIYFCGNFLRQNEIASRQLAHAINYWSTSQMEAQFFHHEGFFGALGALLVKNQSLLH